jgi:hypothetical protein
VCVDPLRLYLCNWQKKKVDTIFQMCTRQHGPRGSCRLLSLHRSRSRSKTHHPPARSTERETCTDNRVHLRAPYYVRAATAHATARHAPSFDRPPPILPCTIRRDDYRWSPMTIRFLYFFTFSVKFIYLFAKVGDFAK